MLKFMITWGILGFLAIFNNACATSQPTSSGPMGDCGNICRGGDVDYFKSRDLECQCQERLGLD